MRVVLVALLLVLINPSSVFGCDICGCGVGGYYSGMLPQYHKNFIGLRWRMSTFQSDLSHEIGQGAGISNEYFHSMELYARVYPHRRVQLLAFIPLSYHLQIAPLETHHLLGLGDISVIGLYNIYNTSFIAERKTKHNVLIGGGLKIPTGTFQRKDSQGELLTPALQLGTGSVDFLLTAGYTLRHQRWGLNSNATYKINLPNKNTYQFGNQFSLTTTTFFLHKIKEKDWGLMPKLGLIFEQATYNLKNGYKRINTGGQQLLATAGLEIYYKKIQLGLQYEQGIWQQLSDGFVQAGPRFIVTVNYLF